MLAGTGKSYRQPLGGVYGLSPGQTEIRSREKCIASRRVHLGTACPRRFPPVSIRMASSS